MTEPKTPPEPQGRVFGIPFDFRPPTLTRAKARWWNPSDPHLFTPRVFGAGWDLNSYWLTHPRAFLAGRKK